MPVTIKDIAQAANVSHSTVSRALQGNPVVSAETAERIRKISREMGYFPSAAARSLKTNRSHALGVILSSVDDPFFSEILRGIEDGISYTGYSLFIAAAQNNPAREEQIVKAMVEHRVDGVIVCSTSFSEDQSGSLVHYGVPIVVVNNQAAEDFRYSIYHDDVDGSRQLTRHLLDLGHKKIAYLGNKLSGRTNQDRISGYRQEMEAAGLPVPTEYIVDAVGNNPKAAVPPLDALLQLADRPTALLCYNDMLAIGVLKHLQQLRIEVPQQFSVTGFDNITFSAYTTPGLTTFDQPKRFIGSEAARLLLELLDTNSTDDHQVKILNGQLLVRGSTAPPPAKNE